MRTQEEIEEWIEQMTLEEKVGMIHGAGLFRTEGVKRLGIPPLIMSDGPMGVRREFADKEWKPIGTTDDFVTYLPCNSAVAATWSRALARKMGEILGEEARGRGKDVILAPGINIQRSPLCGRNFEYMSEDPKLIGELCAPLIEGIQDNDVACCVKHFACNNQETGRLQVNTELSYQAFREIYLPGFEAAIKKGGAYSIMGAYNKLYQEYCCESKFLLDGILREEWGFNGVVISDWGGVHNTKKAAESGLDIEMSGTPDFDEYFLANPVIEAVKRGEIEEKYLDLKVKHILMMMDRLHMLKQDKRKTGCYNTVEHRQGAYEVARDSIILLKNENQLLPLSKDLKKIAVIGQNAVLSHSDGGGSAEIKALYEITPLMGLKSKFGGNCEITYAPGYYIPKKEDEKDLQEIGKTYRKQAIAAAQDQDAVLFIGGLNHEYDVEGRDRENMMLPYEQDELIEALLEVNPNTVIVIVAGSPVDMERWREKAKGIVFCFYAGMEGGNALTDILLGEVSPSGKLPVTFPKHLEDVPAHKFGEFGETEQVIYQEGIFVGYRYYEKANVDVAFPFGYGLSYTTFSYQNLHLEKHGSNICLSLTIENTGDMDGAEVVQIYIADQMTKKRPVKELKGFTKIFLKTGEKKRINLAVTEDDLKHYETERETFVLTPGIYEIMAASSSVDIRLKETIEMGDS